MSDGRIFNVIKMPRFTEKATILGESVYVFKVLPSASKQEIAQAVKAMFKVKVKKITTLNVKGKLKKVRQRLTSKPDWKKAYVTLAAGETISFEEKDK